MGHGTIGRMTPQSQSNRSTSPPSTTSQPRSERGQHGGATRFTLDRPAMQRKTTTAMELAGLDDAAGWQDTPNPFARVLAASEPSATTRFVRAAKTLVIALAMTAVLLAGAFFGKQFLLARLVAGFDDLDAASQQNRLTQIASFGSDAIEPLVGKLAAADDVVSESAFTLLQQMQNDWTMLPPDAAKAAHQRMIGAIATSFQAPQDAKSQGQPSPEQVSRAGELLRQSILEFASTPAQSSKLLVAANRVLTGLDDRSAAIPTLLDSPVKRGAPSKLHAVAKFVQPSSTIQQTGWTDWPPPANAHPAQIVRSGTRQVTSNAETMSASAMPAQPKLQALPHGVTAPLRPITLRDPSPVLHPVGTIHPSVATKRSSARVVQVSARDDVPPLTKLSDAALIRQLTSRNTEMTERVRVELADRGFSKQQTDAAANFLAAGPDERVRLTISLARSGQLGSEPWFSVVLSDPDRRVRLQAASALDATQDATVLANLREHLAREKDPHVAARIRRILQLF